MSSLRSENEWTDLFTGPFRTHHLAESGVRAELSSTSAEPYMPQDRGYQWETCGSETTLSVRLPCGHTGAFHSSGAIPTRGDRFEGWMQDGTITTESLHGRVGSVD
jgi:hypothetical protein